MKPGMISTFSYSRLESDADYSRRRGSVWLTRSLKLLRSAPSGISADPEDSRSDWRRSSSYARHRQRISLFSLKRTSINNGDTQLGRPRSKSAMEQRTSEEPGTATQVELRTEGFQATLLWERIVAHLERTVKCGRHTYALRSYENCFQGHKAVDCLMDYMNSVLPKSVKKSQARLLGQKLLLTKVIEDARKKEKTVFRESRLYRFTGIHFWDPPRDMHGSRGCSSAATEGGIYRCRSNENINQPCREQKRKKASGRSNGYMSDSTLASSSLSRRVVQIRSSRGSRVAPRGGGNAYLAKSQLSSNVQYSGCPIPTGETSVAYYSQQQTSQKSRLSWFHTAAKARDAHSKYRTPTITEEPSILRRTSPPRASPMTPRSPAIDFKVREPYLPIPDGSRGYPAYPNRPPSPDSSCVSGLSGWESSQGSPVRLRDFTLQGHSFHERRMPHPAGITKPTPLLPPKHSIHDSSHTDVSSNEQDPSWVTYGYV